jgi:DNA-binding NtrC family response regulator
MAYLRSELLQLLTISQEITWLALLDKSSLENPKVRELVTANFYDYFHIPIDLNRLKIILGHLYGRAQLATQVSKTHTQERQSEFQEALIGNSPAIHSLLQQVAKISRDDAPVLITGESGTGKKLVANLIHTVSKRAARPFVSVNCAGVQANHFGSGSGFISSLHGQSVSQISTAQRGTIFLDEIGDLSSDMQVFILRIIEQYSIEDTALYARIIAATHFDLMQAVKAGRFRKDLYYHLNVLQLHVPSLQERGSDLEMLANHFLEKYRRYDSEKVTRFSQSAIKAMYSYSWPGNVRELMNRIRSAIVISDGPLITPGDMGLDRRSNERNVTTLEESRAVAERAAILNALEHSGGKISHAAEYLGVSRGTLYRLMEKYAVAWTSKSAIDEQLSGKSAQYTPPISHTSF